MVQPPVPASKYLHAAALAGIVLWYFAASLPFLADYPRPNWDEAEIAAPAYSLQAGGEFGNFLYQGLNGHEHENFYFMPLYPLVQAVVIKLAGLGMAQLRLSAVLFGFGILVLTYLLGRQLRDPPTGLLAAFSLCAVSLSLRPSGSSMPFLDMVRVARFDPLAGFLILAALSVFLRSWPRQSRAGLFTAGLLSGLATLAHVHAPVILAVMAGVVAWQRGRRLWREPALYLIVAGWAVGVLPWIVYIAQDPQAFLHQNRMWVAMGRFDILDPGFYAHNIRAELLRYAGFFLDAGRLRLLPRAGIWVLIGSAVYVHGSCLWKPWLIRDIREKVICIAGPVIFTLMALFMKFKIGSYILLIMPFIALTMGLGLRALWRRCWGAGRYFRAIPVILLVLLVSESGVGLTRAYHVATRIEPYARVTENIARNLDRGARVLAPIYYWVGLRSFDTRSIYLPFFLSNKAYNRHVRGSMTETLRALAPDYIIIDRVTEPRIQFPDGPGVNEQKRQFRAFLAEYCGQTAARLDDRAYGQITVRRCRYDNRPRRP